MSGGIIKTTDMAQRGEDTITNASDLSAKINNLISTVDELLTVWTSGGGYLSFRQAYTEERDYLLEFARNLSAHGEGIVDAAKTLDTADQDVADDTSMINRIEV